MALLSRICISWQVVECDATHMGEHCRLSSALIYPHHTLSSKFGASGVECDMGWVWLQIENTIKVSVPTIPNRTRGRCLYFYLCIYQVTYCPSCQITIKMCMWVILCSRDPIQQPKCDIHHKLVWRKQNKGIVLYCYFLISGKYTKAISNEQLKRQRAKQRQHNRRIMGLIAIFTVFMLCWLPIALTFIIDYKQQLPGVVYVTLISVAWVNSCINVFLYAFTNQTYRHAFRCILTCNWSKINSQF